MKTDTYIDPEKLFDIFDKNNKIDPEKLDPEQKKAWEEFIKKINDSRAQGPEARIDFCQKD